MVSNHGDRFRPLRIGLWDPLQMAFSWLINGGDPNYLLTGMILQVPYKASLGVGKLPYISRIHTAYIGVFVPLF